ncbi:hypothetical protein T492DRAFT_98757 [Pavlovales sp. CCMP2436]|nr:hypothetical protein T492DRAFT_98757 [Pavlovales sp. CCMP2436]
MSLGLRTISLAATRADGGACLPKGSVKWSGETAMGIAVLGESASMAKCTRPPSLDGVGIGHIGKGDKESESELLFSLHAEPPPSTGVSSASRLRKPSRSSGVMRAEPGVIGVMLPSVRGVTPRAAERSTFETERSCRGVALSPPAQPLFAFSSGAFKGGASCCAVRGERKSLCAGSWLRREEPTGCNGGCAWRERAAEERPRCCASLAGEMPTSGLPRGEASTSAVPAACALTILSRSSTSKPSRSLSTPSPNPKGVPRQGPKGVPRPGVRLKCLARGVQAARPAAEPAAEGCSVPSASATPSSANATANCAFPSPCAGGASCAELGCASRSTLRFLLTSCTEFSSEDSTSESQKVCSHDTCARKGRRAELRVQRVSAGHGQGAHGPPRWESARGCSIAAYVLVDFLHVGARGRIGG